VPGSTGVRLVVFRDTFLLGDTRDCRTDDAKTGYILQSCIDDLEAKVLAATDAGLWTILTGGQSTMQACLSPAPNVFQNATLREQFLAMWKRVANHFKTLNGLGLRNQV